PVGSYFTLVRPKNTVLQGGPGAWETVLSVTYLTNSIVQGGIFWRVTPMINWYLNDNLRLEFAYGYGSLDKQGPLGANDVLSIANAVRVVIPYGPAMIHHLL